MKYVVIRDNETGNIIKLGRFSGKPNYIDETYYPKKGWMQDNTLLRDLQDGLLQEISEAEAKHLITTQFSREKQVA
jgi:hypothetical protein